MTFSSISFYIIVYLVQNDIVLFEDSIGKYKWIIFIIYLSIPFVLAFLSLYFCRLLSEDILEEVIEIETSNNDFLANYLSFFFVALSIQKPEAFWIVLFMTLMFTFYSRVSYFNPVFLIMGYNFYYVTTTDNVKIMLISKSKLKSPRTFEPMIVRRINDYTFIGGN
jgi:hypothetical protein